MGIVCSSLSLGEMATTKMEMAKEICKKYNRCFPCPNCLSYETRFDFFNNKSIWQGRFKCKQAKGTKKGFKSEQAKKRRQNLKKRQSMTHRFPPMGKIRDMSYKRFVSDCPQLGMEQKALVLSLLAEMEAEIRQLQVQELETDEELESGDSCSGNGNPNSNFDSGDEYEWQECEFLPNVAPNLVPDIVVALPAFDPNMPLNMAESGASVDKSYNCNISPNSCWQNLPEFEELDGSYSTDFDNQEFLWSSQYPSMMELLECEDSRLLFDQQYTMVL